MSDYYESPRRSDPDVVVARSPLLARCPTCGGTPEEPRCRVCRDGELFSMKHYPEGCSDIFHDGRDG